MNGRILSECIHYTVKEHDVLFPKTRIWIRQNLFHKFEMPYLEVFVTSKCNLRCKDCSNLIPSLHNNSNLSFAEFVSTMDTLLNRIDRLYRLKLHGGEVFLNHELPEIIKYTDSLKKVKSIRLTTNGTIIPNSAIIDALRSSKVVVQISDYELKKSRAQELILLLQENKIKVAYLKNQQWKDMGQISRRNSNRFEECSIKRCTSLLNGKVYVCSRAAMMARLEYIDDNGIDINMSTAEFRKKIMCLYENRNIACSYCDGDTQYASTVLPGVQEVIK